MVRGNQNSLNAILPQELFIPCGLEEWAIVADYLGWETVSCQNIAHGINGCVGCCCLHGIDHFRALRVGVDHNEVVFCLMDGKIYVNALPWRCWPRPWKKRRDWRSLAGFVARLAITGNLFNLLIYLRPPYMTAGYLFYACNFRMDFM